MLFTTFTSLGPIARTCLREISVRDDSTYECSLKVYLNRIDLEIDTFIALAGFHTVENSVHQHASHTMAIMKPTYDGLSYDYRIVTRWVAHKVYEKAQIKSKLRCFELYSSLAHQDPLRRAAEWIFEVYVHNWFRNSGSFAADPLPIGDHYTTPLRFKTCWSKSLNYFTNASSLATQVRVQSGHGIEKDAIGRYFLPYNGNFELVDGLVFTTPDTLILLQITIAKSHDINLVE